MPKRNPAATTSPAVSARPQIMRGARAVRRVRLVNPVVRPVVGGVSASHINVSTGTLGYFFRSTDPADSPDDVFVLSTCHVFADCNRGRIGDPLLQCAPMDGGGAPQTRFATLHRYVPLHVDRETPNEVDAAVGKLNADVEFENSILQIGRVRGFRTAHIGERVMQCGNASGLTCGRVVAMNCAAHVSLDHRNPLKWVPFSSAIRIEAEPPHDRFGRPGDSGALVVAESDGLAVGLYFAGARDGSYGLACPIGPVLERLRLAFI